MPSVRNDPVPIAQLLPLGATVRLRGREATGVIVGRSIDRDRVRVQWDDTGEVAHILISNLERVPGK
jgi:hypothetical protein